jgi:hypothetical protein
MAVGYESQIVNGQLVNVAPGQGFAPLTFGAAYTGPGFWPRNGVFNVPPVTPAPGTTGQGGTTMSGLTAANGSPSLPTAGAVGSDGSVNWFHPTKSPLVMALIFLALGLFMLHKIHFRT